MTDNNSIWCVDYIPTRCNYRIYRYADENSTVAYEDYMESAIHDIKNNYPEWQVILLRKWDSTVDFRVNRRSYEL